MDLKKLAEYSSIVIQCHDVPDADAVGAGYALQRFFLSRGSKASLVYGGSAEIQKPSLIMLIKALNIEISHVTELPGDTDLLITVDSQRGAGNVTNFEISKQTAVVVIDHHRPEIPEHENTVIRPHLASCATLVWDMLSQEGFIMDIHVKTALFYGLYMDTNGLSELRHPLDRDLSEVDCDTGLVRRLKNSSITADELDIIGQTLQNKEVKDGIGLFRAESCDANLLGFTSDIAQQVAHMDCCIIYCLQQNGIKLSIRSSAREIMASEIAAFLCQGVGNGGGAAEKAGGYMSFGGIAELSGQDPENYLRTRIHDYTYHFDYLYAANNKIDFHAMRLYQKLPIPVGFVKSTDVFPKHTKITVRTLEGDVDTTAGDNLYLMIGLLGEVYPIKKDRFEANYRVLNTPYSPQLDYVPALLNRVTGERREIFPYTAACIPTGDKFVRGIRLDKPTKVFTQWDLEKYFTGSKGDWLVADEANYQDCYIVRSDIFEKSYVACDRA